ncbi:MAG: hypothetical protein WC503_04325 [Candidatus Shapirobacteria bacterium]
MRNKLFLLAALTILVLAMSACVVAVPAPVAVQPADSESAVVVNQNTTVNVIVDQNADGCTTCDSVPAVVAPAFVPTSWDTTCTAQSALVGVTMTPLQEGPAVACIWSGPATDIFVPSGTYADVDKGSVFVVVGEAYVPAVGRLTLRHQETGNVAELCSHLQDLTVFGAEQNPPFTPSPWNFTCGN